PRVERSATLGGVNCYRATRHHGPGYEHLACVADDLFIQVRYPRPPHVLPSMDRLALLLQFHEEDPADAFTLFAIAQEYLKRDAPDEALAFFEKLRHDQPDYTGTYYHLGKLYERLGRNDDA